MICPKCGKELNVVEQLKSANEDYYEGVEPPILLMIDCDNCEEQVVTMEIYPVEGFDEIESPVGTVKVPKL